MNCKGDDNRSVRETKARIRTAFLELLKKKHYAKISVREIAEKANINRSTFYLHYQDVYDLLDQIEEQLNSQLVDALKKITREGYVPGKHPQHTNFFKAMDRNIELYRILMSENGRAYFIPKMAKTVRDAFYGHWSSFCGNDTPENLDMYVTYTAYGMIGIFLSQMDAEKQKSVECMGYFAGEVTNWVDERFVALKPNG